MENSNADSILELSLSVVISYYLIYKIGLRFIELYEVKSIIVVTSIMTQGILMIFAYGIIKKLGYTGVLIIHKPKGIKEFFLNYFKIYFITFLTILIFYPVIDYCLVRLNQPLSLIILCVTFTLLLIIFRIYYVHTYFERKIHFGVYLIPCMFYIFLILNSFILVIVR